MAETPPASRPQEGAGTMPGNARNPDDNLRIPRREGQPPRPATEPAHAEGSTRNPHTLTDPATGEPSRHEE